MLDSRSSKIIAFWGNTELIFKIIKTQNEIKNTYTNQKLWFTYTSNELEKKMVFTAQIEKMHTL